MSFITADEDWFSEIAEDDLGDTADSELAALAGDMNPASTCTIELYDLDSTCHISPYHKNFKTLIEIPLKSFTAANKQSLNTTTIGNMVIKLPNGLNVSQLQHLLKVLFSPNVGYTLVSIG